MGKILYETIGTRIRRTRERLGLSQQDLAGRLGYSSPATVSHFESGDRRISIADLQAVSRALGLPVSHFLEDEEDGGAHAAALDGGGATGGRQSQLLQHLHFRAKEIAPASRGAVVDFLVFAKTHGKEAPPPPFDPAAVKPWQAAARVREIAGVQEEVPVSPRRVADGLGIPVFEWHFPDEVSGVLVCEAERYCIGVNERHPGVRQRFTIAHELGHWALDGDRDFFDYAQVEFAHYSEASPGHEEEDARREEQERRANRFAADLLMPAGLLRRDVEQGGPDVPQLARKYGVSQHALWSRLLGLGLARDLGRMDGASDLTV
jgi:Zn-dependent peptidase ImmA (M78 family)/DNA-binding XRE family transcriptional regulator